jgi:hypothetical protein
MKNFLKNNDGSILGITMIYFLVFAITGTAILMVAALFRLDTQDEVHAITNKYAVESTLNLALWRVNNGMDSLATFQNEGVSSQYIDSSMTLIVSTSQWGESLRVTVDLELETAFSNPVSITGTLDTSNITLTSGYNFQKIDSLPKIDLNYYYQNADYIYTGDQSFEGPLPSGIHYVENGKVTLRNDFHLVGTLVVLDELKVVGTNVLLQAGQDSSGTYLPALIVTDSVTTPETEITDITIEGAIYSTGEFEIKKGFFTGPFIGTELEVKNSLTIDPTGAEQYYSLPPGFEAPDPLFARKWIKKGSWR